MARWFALGLILTLAACAGGGGSSVLPKSSSAPAKAKVTVSIRMHVPGAASTRVAALKRIFTAAQNTAGAQVNVYTAGDDSGTPLATTAANITAGSADCTASDSYGNRTCTFDIAAPVGTEDFVITTWNEAPLSGSIPGGAAELGWGSDTGVDVTPGSSPTVSATLSSVLNSVSIDLTPNTLHQLIPSTGTIGVYALDASGDVIVSNGYVDGNGNPVTLSLGYDNSLYGAFNLSTTTLTAPSPTGVLYTYTPSGVLSTAGNNTVNVSVSASSASVTTTGAALTALYPVFTSITDGNLNTNNSHHGGMIFNTAGGVFYTTPSNFGGISYYSGSGSTVTNNYAATSTSPIYGSIVNAAGTYYAIAGNSELTFFAPPSSTIGSGPNGTLAPVPNGSAIAANGDTIWYTSGSTLASYPLLSGSPSTTPLGVNVAAGLAIDSSSNVWVVDNVDDQLIEYPSMSTFPLQPGGTPWDVLINNNGIYVTDHGEPAIIQLSSSGNIVNTISVPDGATPWYLMPDSTQQGIIWFDYLQYGQIGIGRMDTNVSPPSFVMATDVNGPFGSEAGAIGAASNGLVYMVFDDTSTLVQVQR